MTSSLASQYAPAPRPRTTIPAAAHLLFALLARIDRGRLDVRAPDGRVFRFGPGGSTCDGLSAQPALLELADWHVAAAALKGGDVGFAESYMSGHWNTPDLVRLLTTLAVNQPALERVFYGHAWTRGLLRLRHWLNSNTKRRAKRNISLHYDLGNDFYALWLDSTMTYSSALYSGDRTQPLEQAQQAKYRRLLDELALPAAGHLLEIGSGWGGFAEMAARAGHRVTGISLSKQQTAWARERIERAGLAGRADLRVQDYRDLRGRHDGVASIEMFEAVGEKYWPAYFAAVHDVLEPGARACIQAITIAEERFERYRTQSDFIQQYVFPGGMLASPPRLVAEAEQASLRLVRSQTFGGDYAETLERWLAAFEKQAAAIAARFDASFVRCWRFYLAYCAAGFHARSIDVGQYTFERR